MTSVCTLARPFGGQPPDIDVVVPDEAGRTMVSRVVFEEIIQGRFLECSRAAYVDVIVSLGQQGDDAVVLACTDIGLLLPPDASPPLSSTLPPRTRTPLVDVASAD